MRTSTPPAPAHGHRWWPSRGTREGAAPVTDLGRLLLGLVVLGLGVLLLLDAAGVVSSDRAIGDWWPVVIVAAGLLTLLERPPAVVRGLVVTAVGAVLLLLTTGVLDESAWDYIWPALVIVAGLAILLHWSGRRIASATDGDVIRTTAVFGGSHPVSTSPAFRGASLTAIFGGVALDLRGARPAPDASVNATAAFGGIDILVPRGWVLDIRSTPIFGGVDDKTEHPADPPAPGAPVLHIDAVCVFGGVSVKHDE
jgi:hypothetical protein